MLRDGLDLTSNSSESTNKKEVTKQTKDASQSPEEQNKNVFVCTLENGK